MLLETPETSYIGRLTHPALALGAWLDAMGGYPWFFSHLYDLVSPADEFIWEHTDAGERTICKLRKSGFRLDIRKTFFMVKVLKYWNGLPREVVNAPSLETLRARLDGALSNLIWLKMSLLIAGGLD